ncbi:MAG: hypothetical protein EOO46_23770 [Flavobacterium sp.]|nr:MAG: hypothetical protein EOO46_23770 [Flavobacterium sp.]
MKNILMVEFHQPEFDILRREIGRCFVINAYHACITLTNHLLERYCKILLISFESGFKTIVELESLESIFEAANKKYLKADLNETLNACRTLGLITKEERKEFDVYRETFRNGFGHADPTKILGDSKGGFMLGSFNGNKESEFQELTYSKVPLLHGLAVESFSKVNALPYFIAVENLIRKTIHKIQPDDAKVEYELI